MFKLSWAMLKMESCGHKFAHLFPLTVILCALCLQDSSAGPPTSNPGEQHYIYTSVATVNSSTHA